MYITYERVYAKTLYVLTCISYQDNNVLRNTFLFKRNIDIGFVMENFKIYK